MPGYTISFKQQEILKFLQKTKEIEQSRIIEHFANIWKYNNYESAKVSIGSMLKKLEAQKKVISRQDLNKSKGCAIVNLWKPK